jgi:hypothetical protein
MELQDNMLQARVIGIGVDRETQRLVQLQHRFVFL